MSHRYVRAAVVLGAAAVTFAQSERAEAALFADKVESYYEGAISSYLNPATALGQPNADVNAGTTYGYGALTPHNATWQSTEMVGIGAGGSLTLHLPEAAAKIGVHAGVGLIDSAWPTGQNPAEAATYTSPRQADVSVSANGIDFVTLGLITFDSPTNFYDEGVTAPGNQTSPGTHATDFGKPYTGTLADFNGKDWAGTLQVLGGSAGGEWLDVSSVLPAGASYVRFSVPLGQADPMYVDAVAAVPVPEPAAAIVLAVLPALLLGGRRHRRFRR